MRKSKVFMIGFFAFIIFVIIFMGFSLFYYYNWPKFPVSLTCSKEIKQGHKAILALEKYKLERNTLPENNDWDTLREINFPVEREGYYPCYKKINDREYELTFVFGFDGPYLIYLSNEKIWKLK